MTPNPWLDLAAVVALGIFIVGFPALLARVDIWLQRKWEERQDDEQ